MGLVTAGKGQGGTFYLGSFRGNGKFNKGGGAIKKKKKNDMKNTSCYRYSATDGRLTKGREHNEDFGW